MVALIDAADVLAEEIPWRHANQRLRNFSTVLHEGDGASVFRRALRIAGKAARKARNLSVYLVQKRVDDLWTKLQVRLFRHHLDRGVEPPYFVQSISVRTAYLFAEKAYRPTGVFDGELVLFRATEGVDNDEPYINRYTDPLFGWASRASGGVRAHDVPGGHSSMLQEPNVEVLANYMQTIIDNAFSNDLPKHQSATAAVS